MSGHGQGLRARFQTLHALVAVQTSLVGRDLERFMLVPLLEQGLQLGRIEAGQASGRSQRGGQVVDAQALQGSLAKVRALALTWGSCDHSAPHTS